MGNVASQSDKVRVSLYLPKVLVDRLDREAVELGVSRGAVVIYRLKQAFDDSDTSRSMNRGINGILDGSIPLDVVLNQSLKRE